MVKPVGEWDEEYILSLPSENFEVERKNSKKLDLKLGADENDVLNELAKQLSAFANMGGGKIIYGLNNDGSIDGGVSKEIKKNGTKEWLEQQIPNLTEYEVLGVNVFEIEAHDTSSQIGVGKALYVIDVPDSDRAPHQSKRDCKYYVRMASQSLPARHRTVEDIRNRLKHQKLRWSDGGTAENLRADQDITPSPVKYAIKYVVQFMLRLVLFNGGPLQSVNTFAQFKPTEGELDNIPAPQPIERVNGTKNGIFQWSLARPLPPESEVVLQFQYCFRATLENFMEQNGGMRRIWVSENRKEVDDVAIEWTIFADSAPPCRGILKMRDWEISRKINQYLS
jgi:Putative DNA-binding domain